MNITDSSKFPLVVVVGGGFGGLQVAKHLKDKPVEVLMLDKHNYHTFQPLLYQVAMGSLESESIAFSLRKNFASQKNFRFRIAEVTKINAAKNTIDTTIGEIAYDYLVIATGSTTNFFGNKDIEKFSMPMKSIPEALNLRYDILQNIEEALLKPTKEERDPYLTFVLVGAGPTGVELSGSLAELRNHILTKDYPELKKEDMKVYLVDFLPKVLGPFSDEASHAAKEFLTGMGVEVLLGMKVESYDGEQIKFEGGKTIRTKNVIWSAGVMGVIPEGIAKDIIERGNRIRTDSICRVVGTNNIFAIGDVAAMITHDTPKGHPGVAQVAIQMGQHVAKSITALINHEPTAPFKYFDKGSLATIGRNKAVADLGKIKFQGFFAWLVWMFVHLISLLGGRNKVIVFINWVSSYVTYNGGTRLIIRKFEREGLTEDHHLPNTVD
ncbi:NAD(P)/FAD-dependent oxidoreductase [Mucilaginibacter sabulilitoris]|uniref:NADH:ubiquinone reductase (non-electrogenic) n=1 Tax=Mucilaginibacter sabulilitoris TaxID=1173583 RepID=A0ABZ0TLF0_9SPHI|nr:NAD(P)/FAD-dependent oxidoreductase [Mucilaginibacter sabulilitoris]WPU92554.1 NAD(P)/FAD-dependent oxidoreductase [Mucilaginibacter sabulilitoris]